MKKILMATGVLLGILLIVPGCGSDATNADEEETVGSSAQALTPGCHTTGPCQAIPGTPLVGVNVTSACTRADCRILLHTPTVNRTATSCYGTGGSC